LAGWPLFGNCGLPDEHEGPCVWDALLTPELPRFTIIAPCGANLELRCHIPTCPQPDIHLLVDSIDVGEVPDEIREHMEAFHS
jgi:hypothetical protein